MRFFVIPAKAGIQSFQKLIKTLDSGFHGTTFYEIINPWRPTPFLIVESYSLGVIYFEDRMVNPG